MMKRAIALALVVSFATPSLASRDAAREFFYGGAAVITIAMGGFKILSALSYAVASKAERMRRDGFVLTPQGDTPYHLAVFHKNPIGLQNLLANFSNYGVNLQNQKGETALHMAARMGRLGHVEVLLRAHASASIVDESGFTPLSRAVEAGHTQVVHAIERFGTHMKEQS